MFVGLGHVGAGAQVMFAVQPALTADVSDVKLNVRHPFAEVAVKVGGKAVPE
jgi:hypothetical protein